MSDLVVRKAVLSDLDALKSIADAHKHELGFVLRPALADSINRGQVLIAENSAGPIGFVEYRHRRDEQTTLYHIAVSPDHRRQGIGRRLMTALADDARRHDKIFIQLKCPAGLPANRFYARLGFQHLLTENGRRRPLLVWRIDLHIA